MRILDSIHHVMSLACLHLVLRSQSMRSRSCLSWRARLLAKTVLSSSRSLGKGLHVVAAEVDLAEADVLYQVQESIFKDFLQEVSRHLRESLLVIRWRHFSQNTHTMKRGLQHEAIKVMEVGQLVAHEEDVASGSFRSSFKEVVGCQPLKFRKICVIKIYTHRALS